MTTDPNLLLRSTTEVAVRLYGRSVQVWVTMLGTRSWRALVIRRDNKVTMCFGPLTPSHDEALRGLRSKLEKMAGTAERGR